MEESVMAAVSNRNTACKYSSCAHVYITVHVGIAMLGCLRCTVYITKRVEAMQCRDDAVVRGVVGFCRMPTVPGKRMHAITASKSAIPFH